MPKIRTLTESTMVMALLFVGQAQAQISKVTSNIQAVLTGIASWLIV